MEPFVVLLLLAGLFFYFFPSMIAHQRRAQRGGVITLVNVLLGWTVIGWVCCLIWAIVDDRLPAPIAAAPLPTAEEQRAFYASVAGTEIPPSVKR